MSYGFGPANSRSAFLPSEFELPEDNLEMRDIIGDRENLTANIVNIREIGQYEQSELLTAQTWFKSNTNQSYGESPRARYGYRRTFDLVEMNLGPITAGATTFRVSPVITSIVIPTRAFGAGTIAGPQYVFFPSDQVRVTFNNTDPTKQTITITNNLGANMTQCYVTIEYLKQS